MLCVLRQHPCESCVYITSILNEDDDDVDDEMSVPSRLIADWTALQTIYSNTAPGRTHKILRAFSLKKVKQFQLVNRAKD